MSFFISLFLQIETTIKKQRRFLNTKDIITNDNREDDHRVDDIFQNNTYPRVAETTTVAVSLCLEMDSFEGDHVSVEYFFKLFRYFSQENVYIFLHIGVGVGTAVK